MCAHPLREVGEVPVRRGLQEAAAPAEDGGLAEPTSPLLEPPLHPSQLAGQPLSVAYRAPNLMKTEIMILNG